MLIGGVVTDDVLSDGPGFLLSFLLRDLPGLIGLSSSEIPVVASWLQGWPGVWALSAVPCLIAMILAGLSKTASVPLDRPR